MVTHVQAEGGRVKGHGGDGGGGSEVSGVTVTHDDGGAEGDPIHPGWRQRQQANVAVLIHHQHLHTYASINRSW